MPATEFVDPELLTQERIGRADVSAKHGLRNHWYPALFVDEVVEGQPVPVTLLGENILRNRIDGKRHS